MFPWVVLIPMFPWVVLIPMFLCIYMDSTFFIPVVKHIGVRAAGGHYTADVFHPGINGWVHYDDSIVHTVPLNSVLRFQGPKMPYLLYYKRLDTHWSWGEDTDFMVVYIYMIAWPYHLSIREVPNSWWRCVLNKSACCWNGFFLRVANACKLTLLHNLGNLLMLHISASILMLVIWDEIVCLFFIEV